jgi:hypothetical protein
MAAWTTGPFLLSAAPGAGKTRPALEQARRDQIVGRFVRTISGRPAEPSWLYIPADPVLRDHAASVEHELRRALRTSEDDAAVEFDRAERLETERGETPAFVPLSADVAPQMTLFGSPAPATLSAWPAPATLSAWPAPATSSAWPPPSRQSPPRPSGDDRLDKEMPAFERRAMLRSERRRLVSEVTRRDGTSHREINAWLNRKLGISSVDHATLEDLERSVELLVGKLSARR